MHQCNPVLHHCNRFLDHIHQKHLLRSLLTTFGSRFRVPDIELKNPQARNSEKKTNKKTKKKLRNSPTRVGPRKYEKNTEKIRKRSFWGHSCVFLYSFRIFGARPGVGNFVILFVFPGLRFFELYIRSAESQLSGHRSRNLGSQCQAMVEVDALRARPWFMGRCLEDVDLRIFWGYSQTLLRVPQKRWLARGARSLSFVFGHFWSPFLTLLSPKAPGRTKNTTVSKFTTYL